MNLRRAEMDAFDRLPKSLRRALDEANYKFVSTVYAADLRYRVMTCAELVRQVKHLSAKETKRRDALKAAGKIPHDLY